MRGGQDRCFDVFRGIRDARQLKGAEREVLHQLILRCDPKWMCFPSCQTLAYDSLLDITTVRKAITRLEKAGWIRRKKRANRSCRYWVEAEWIVEAGRAAAAERKRQQEGTSDDLDDRLPNDLASTAEDISRADGESDDSPYGEQKW